MLRQPLPTHSSLNLFAAFQLTSPSSSLLCCRRRCAALCRAGAAAASQAGAVHRILRSHARPDDQGAQLLLPQVVGVGAGPLQWTSRRQPPPRLLHHPLPRLLLMACGSVGPDRGVGDVAIQRSRLPEVVGCPLHCTRIIAHRACLSARSRLPVCAVLPSSSPPTSPWACSACRKPPPRCSTSPPPR